MNEEDSTEMGFMVELSDDEIRLLLHCVKETLRSWPGFPARPAEEQEFLWNMRDNLFKMTLEMNWDLEA